VWAAGRVAGVSGSAPSVAVVPEGSDGTVCVYFYSPTYLGVNLLGYFTG